MDTTKRFFIITDRQIEQLKVLIARVSSPYVSEEGLDEKGEAKDTINELFESIQRQELRPK